MLRRSPLRSALVLSLVALITPAAARTTFIKTGTSWTAPSDFNRWANIAYTLGAGGDGSAGCHSNGSANSATGGAGAGSAAIAYSFNVNIHPNDAVSVQVGAHGQGQGAGNYTLIKDTLGATLVSAQSGGNGDPCKTMAAGVLGGLPGLAANSIGDVKFSGGEGGSQTGGGTGCSAGGAGAPSPLGVGKDGGDSPQCGAPQYNAGGGGVGGPYATAGIQTGAARANGGNGPHGFARALSPIGGGPGITGPPGNGGSGATNDNLIPCAAYKGGDGRTYPLWRQTSDGAIAGPSSGPGGGTGHDTTCLDGGGDGGDCDYLTGFGGAGAGGGAAVIAPGLGGRGCDGIIVIIDVPIGELGVWAIINPALTSATVPDDFASFVSAECIGAGGNGALAVSKPEAGGGGGEYRKEAVANFTASTAVNVSIAVGGSNTFTTLQDSTATTIVSCDAGDNGSGQTGGLGGQNGIGSAANFNGGKGGDALGATTLRPGGAGAGSAGRNGPGRDGGKAPNTQNGASPGGGGEDGGLSSPGSDGSGTLIGGLGGKDPSGAGAGLGATSTTYAEDGHQGGAGGARYNASYIGGWGACSGGFLDGAGNPVAEFGACSGGGGSSPSNGPSSIPSKGGYGGFFGGGGAGAGSGNVGNDGIPGPGGQGIIFVTYARMMMFGSAAPANDNDVRLAVGF